MEEYLFEGMIQGQFKYIQIYSMSEDTPNHYLIHWDGSKICDMDKVDGTWQSIDEVNNDFIQEIGSFIDGHEAKLKDLKDASTAITVNSTTKSQA